MNAVDICTSDSDGRCDMTLEGAIPIGLGTITKTMKIPIEILKDTLGMLRSHENDPETKILETKTTQLPGR